MSTVIKLALLLLGATLVAMIVRVILVSASHASTPDVQTQRVRVAAADLPQGLLLREEDLAWKNVPITQVPGSAIVQGVTGGIEFKGALLRHPVGAGSMLVADDVILPSDPGFLAATLQPNMRAVSVAVDDVSGNAGLIQPGDYVDVLLTQQMNNRTDGASPDYSVSSETVVEHVRVLASGSDITRPKSGSSISGEINRARTVTLEVTPRMGEVIAVASHLGSLSLALRSFATASRDPVHAGASSATLAQPDVPERGPVWAGDISRALRQVARPPSAPDTPHMSATAPAAPQLHTVTVYRGSDHGDGGAPQSPTAGATVGSIVGMPPLPALPTAR